MRARSLALAPILALAFLPSGPADGATTETCFDKKPDKISTKNRDTAVLGHGGPMVVIIKGDNTEVSTSFDDDPPVPPGGVFVCVKKGADHVRVSGVIHKLHSGGEDTRLRLSACVLGDPLRFYRVYQIDVWPCDPEVLAAIPS